MIKIKARIKDITTKNLVSLDKSARIVIEVDNAMDYVDMIRNLDRHNAETIFNISFEEDK